MLVLVFKRGTIGGIVSTAEPMPLLFTLDFCPAVAFAVFVFMLTFMILAAVVSDVGEKDVIVLPPLGMDAIAEEKDAAGVAEELLIAIV